jgi:hypothetical protein
MLPSGWLYMLMVETALIVFGFYTKVRFSSLLYLEPSNHDLQRIRIQTYTRTRPRLSQPLPRLNHHHPLRQGHDLLPSDHTRLRTIVIHSPGDQITEAGYRLSVISVAYYRPNSTISQPVAYEK